MNAPHIIHPWADKANHPWFRDGELCPYLAADWTLKLCLLAGSKASTAYLCAQLIAADLERRLKEPKP